MLLPASAAILSLTYLLSRKQRLPVCKRFEHQCELAQTRPVFLKFLRWQSYAVSVDADAFLTRFCAYARKGSPFRGNGAKARKTSLFVKCQSACFLNLSLSFFSLLPSIAFISASSIYFSLAFLKANYVKGKLQDKSTQRLDLVSCKSSLLSRRVQPNLWAVGSKGGAATLVKLPAVRPAYVGHLNGDVKGVAGRRRKGRHIQFSLQS